MEVLFTKVKKILNSEVAAIKLFIIRFGLAVDGLELAKKIENYPEG